MKYLYLSIVCMILLFSCGLDRNSAITREQPLYNEPHRPQFHFSPPSNWMNDPNGMIYHDGVYHLFYQHYPDSNVWGPMHWGHAKSRDLVHWEHLPIAIYPDSLGYIFSGSAVFDKDNTSGLGTQANPPLVAIFTYHNPNGDMERGIDVESQGIAYSIDAGKSWIKYANNPVLRSPGERDFRDPKVHWHEASGKWIMTLAVNDHVSFYSSPNLKDWSHESDFGKDFGAHSGVWECPDLFPCKMEGNQDTQYYILIVSINRGGPNAGSATQYFIGNFNGNAFTPIDSKIRWIDYGPDNYAGITWSNTDDRTIFLGWMSNWAYAQVVPTEAWRSANTIARELRLVASVDGLTVASRPVEEMEGLMLNKQSAQNLLISDSLSLFEKCDFKSSTFDLRLDLGTDKDFQIELCNDQNEDVVISYSRKDQMYLIDRRHLNTPEFHPMFASVLQAPRLSESEKLDLRLIVDVASIELFADGGRTVMTAIIFPDHKLDQLKIKTSGELKLERVQLNQVKSIW